MSNITETEVREASGDELNKLVELWCKRDDLRVPIGQECLPGNRMDAAVRDWKKKPFTLSEFGIPRGTEESHIWDTRHGKPYQSDLENHVNNWRAKARDFEGDMNLAITLWRDEFNRLYRHRDMWFVSIWKTYRIGDDRVFEAEKPEVAICRAAVILAIRKRGEK